MFAHRCRLADAQPTATTATAHDTTLAAANDTTLAATGDAATRDATTQDAALANTQDSISRDAALATILAATDADARHFVPPAREHWPQVVHRAGGQRRSLRPGE